MSMNEADTRYHLIDPLLRAKGYVSRAQITLETILTPSPVEPTGAKGRRRKGPGRTDYLLCVQLCVMPKPLPIAVLEAKKESEDPLAGMQQAKGYADGERFDVKYVFATNGHRYGEFDCVTKPALFLCDRDELREQAYTKLKAAFGDNARIVKTERGSNAARNARIHIATYQTLGLDDDDDGFASFLSEHYGENAFSVIIIDECHRSAWGRWSEVLRCNPNAIHIGLTATPRQLHEAKNAPAEDREITANNRKYFGEPVYEYTLIQAQEDGYLAACEIVKRKASIDSATFIWDGRLNNCYFQKALHRLRPHAGIANSEFLALWIRFQAASGAFEHQNAKTTIAHLPLVRLEKLLVPDITVEEQRHIAARLKAQLAEVDKARRAAEMQLREINTLPARLLAQAFKDAS